MKLKDSLNKRLNTRLASLVMLSVLSVPWVASAAGNSVVANNMLPGNGKQGTVVAGSIEGGFNGSWAQGNQMNLHQTTQNAIVTWDSFSIGANATVTIHGEHDNFNMLNYVTGSESSQIYGKLNSYVGDKQGGNIYLVNPNGVQIGNSAEINVGSLHIANKKIDNIDTWNVNTDIAKALKQNREMTDAELMSLGYINANKLVFEGERVVIDMDRLSGLDTTKSDALTIVSKPYDDKSVGDNRKYDIVLGSSTPEKAAEWGKYIEFADNGTGDRWQGTVQAGNPDALNQSVTEFFTYRWIKDGKELENIGKKQYWGMGDHYALRYSIDLTGSDQNPIGTEDNAFKGKFDGLDNSIFGLSIDNSDNSKGNATGLFGFTDGAIMGNVTLIAGTDGISVQGGDNTGAFIGHAVNTTVKGVNSTLKVSGKNNVGGIIGYAKDDTGRTYSFADASGSVQPDSRSSELSNLTNTGNVSGVSNVGGLVGYMDGGKLSNDEENRIQYKGSYNLGKITGIDNVPNNYSSNIGGLVGKAENATVGGTKNTLINYNTVEGGYNVGGIVGSISNTTVDNASNEGVVKANGYTTDSYIYHTDYQKDNWQNNDSVLTGTHKAEVRVANVGGIVGSSSAGSELRDVTNKADVSSALVKQTITSGDHPDRFEHYAAGNVGGIVGRAEDSNITNANNVESNIRGAMNVGGIAGYFGSTDVNNAKKKDYRILNAINNGGDIMATGGIKSDGSSFAYEITRSDYDPYQDKEKYITGNIGGIAGYLYGAPVRIEAGGNRGDVHTAADMSKLTAQAANVGGIVGKIDMPKATGSDGNVLTDKERLDIIKGDTSAAGNSGYANAVVSSSYNTGNVKGYANIGGIGGFAYNGSIAGSYNVGDIHTTRADKSGTTPINMGGILGDSTEKASGRVIIYDTYNKGTIGDSSFSTFGRHVGGIVGRLSGIVEKSYNNGEIYNGLNVVGGIAGYWYSGYLKNVFNTGNITVYNKNYATSQVGGIAGSVDLSGGNQSSGNQSGDAYETLSISNAYNLGSLRSFKGSSGSNELGGILGATYKWNGTNNRLKISNVYTMGNLYVDGGFIGDIVGVYERGTQTNPPVDYENVYYIRPQTDNGYIDVISAPSGLYLQKNATVIDYDKLNDPNAWSKFSFSKQTDGKIEGATDNNWRMSDGSLPILNAFLSGSHNYFSQESNWQKFIKDNKGANVQYGTAYDPLLTIINTKKDLSFNWSDMDLKNNGSLAVFGLPNADNTLRYTPGLTLNNVEITNSTHVFGGTIYSDGLLELNAKDNLQGGLRFGMDSMLYGSDVVLNTNSSMELSGSVISTGNHNELSSFNPEKSLQHGITINAADLTVYGKLITMGNEKEGTDVIVPGINYGYVDSKAPDKDKVSDKTKAMTSQGMAHAYQLHTATAKTGDITISTMENTLADGTYMSGSANLLYGNYKKGKIETKGNLTVSSSGDILVDSDLDIAGSINLSGADVPDEPGTVYVNDITLDLSNIGGELTGNDKVKALHKFIDAHTTKATGIYGSNNSELTDDKHSMKITFDLWDDNYTFGGVTGNLNFAKNDLKENDTTVKVSDKLQNLYVESAGENYKGDKIRNVIYTWISNAEELNSLQRVAQNMTDRDALSYNYVLKNDIDASGLVNAEGKSTYNTIGGGTTAFTGTFDGDGHTIVGLQAKGGIFGKLGSGAVVKNINIASSVFTGNDTGDSVGAVAAENNGGKISGISGYGNTVKGSSGYIGGLVGKNYGGITNSDDQSTVIAGANTVAGGIAGVNGGTFDWSNFEAKIGYIDNVQSNSAVTTAGLSADQYASNLGGIVGINEKHELSVLGPEMDTDIDNVSAHGVTGKAGSTKISGGIVGTNNGKLTNVYNESIIHGSEAIGGIAGTNVMDDPDDFFASQPTLENIANAVEIIGDAGSQNVGGLVGMQDHAATNQGRNTGAITGCTNVGGMVGYNTAGSYLNNLENSPQATITGIKNVGGIAGVNEGVISADDQLNLLNSGKIYGWENVGGIAGKNSGTIDNVNSNINLYVIDDATRTALKGSTEIVANAQFFGGVTGENIGIITNATNRARVDAAQASYVGGIVGRNTSEDGKVGQLLGMGNSNEGFVIGNNYVGGVIGKNEVDITGTSEQSVGIVNSGTVIALAGGAGGIIGENSANITYVNMTNEGEVHGSASADGTMEENGTGGIIGVNAVGANISNSSLMNRVNGNVSGVANVGGIIGINHGVITGGRDDKNNYYKYQIYNNGTIQAGSYDATNGTITAVDGENIGGLLGNNSGKLTAGYNTGVVDAGQSSNVGGIAGTNSGTLNQVFNSVVTVTKTETGATDADGRKLYNYTYTDGGAISGASNVGGIVGSNTAGGQLSNAYSTTAVAGNSNVANIVGSNAGQVSNIYGYAANGNTNVNGGTVRNSYIIKKDGTLKENGKDAKKLDSYTFDYKDTTWKLYDKRTNPLLKVFLTKVTVDGDLQKGWVYDATNHLDIHGWIENGKLKTNDAANDAFAAYKNNNSLLQGEALKNVGDYSSWLWSGQIASGGVVGPNNLGYDFTVGDITVTKKVLNVTGNTVNRTYGDLKKKDDYELSVDYELSINGFDGFNDAMKAELDGKVTIIDSQDKIQNNQDTGIITVGDEKRTDNKGTYEWQAGVKLDGSLTGNYEFQNDGVSSTTTTVHGVSNVLARKIYLNNINANTTYGSKEGLKADGNVSLQDNSIVYGDQVSLKDGASVSYKVDGEYAANKGDRDTADAGTYDNSLKIDNAALTGDEDKLGNYELVNDATGDITVKKATLNVGLNDVVRTYGNTSFTDGKGYGIKDHDALVNGDKGTVSLNKDAITDGGLVDNNSKTNNKGDYKWNVGENGIVAENVANFAKNYDIKVTAGNSKVNAKKIYLNNINASTTYGSKEGLKADGNVSLQDNSIVYGDKVSLKDGASVSYKADGEYAANKDGRDTADAGEYKKNVVVTGAELVGNELGNYELVNNATGVITVKKATLNVGLNDVVRTYGDTSFTDGTGYGIKDHDALVNGDKGTVSLNKDAITDGGLVDNNSKTNNKGDYKWNVGENGIVAENVANFAKNYDIKVTAGNSKVNAKKIYLNNINASTTYGSKEGLKADGNVSLQDNSIVYGDKVSLKDGASVSYKADGEYAANKDGRDTADAGEYKKNVVVTGAELVGNELGNYELVNNATGVITVKKATLNVGLNDVVRTYGDTSFTDGTGYGIKDHDALVNGDKGTVSLNKDAITDGGLVDNNSKTNNKGDYKWNVGENGIVAENVANFAKNYDIKVTAGNSKVNAKKIYLNNINASTTYGSKEGLKADGNVSLQDNSIVYGDKVSLKDGASVSYKADGEYAANKDGRDTADAGEYKKNVVVTGAELVGNELGNYELVNNATGVITVKKATLNVGLNDVVRTYGDTSFTDGTGYGIKDHDALVNGDKGTVSLNKDAITDGGLVDNNSKTNNKGDYKWNVGENGIVAENVANFAKNYDIKVTAGNSKVNAKKIYLNNINASTTYGSKEGLKADGNVSLQDNSIVYGDKVSLKDGASVSYKADGEYAANKDGRDTADAGEYKKNVVVTGAELVGNELGNYELVNNATGVITVKKATLNVGLNDVVRTYGNATITSGGYSAGNITGLVNGDNYGASDFKVTVNSDGAIAGVTGDRVTNDHGEYTWNGTIETANAGLNKNYDLVVNANGKSYVDKATLNVSLNDVVRTYGNATITSGGYSASNITGLVNGDSYNAGDVKVTVTGDGALTGNTEGKVTNNAGDYTWSGTATTDNAGLGKNYNLVVTANGKSTVEKANLVVNLNDITRVYGNLDAKDYSKAFTFGANAGLVNGDSGLVINADKDGAIAEGSVSDVKKTNNVGSYKWNGTASGVENLNTNYDVQINAGKSDVTKANLVVNLNDITRVYGNLDAKDYSKAFTFGANAGLVNGDSGLVINADKDGAIAEGSVSDVKKTNNVGSYKWNGTASGVDNLNTNYNVQINAGKSDVTKANLVVNLNDITRGYGNLDAKDYSNAYTFGANAGLVNGDNGLVINANKDGAIAEGSVGDVKKTNNVGNYEWNGTASGVDNLNTNYDVTVNAGKSDVTKANLVVNLNDITRVYGNLEAKDYSNAFTFGANAGLVNGDNGLVINADADGAITEGSVSDVKKTNNVGSYKWNGTASGVENLNTNYDVQINAGKSDVTKANLVVNLNDITRVYGNLDAKDYSNAFTFGANA
ncbi:filamentous hemagglutinin N-terminal domain-containing protein, partial [Phascolarctobacterium succinatutens]